MNLFHFSPVIFSKEDGNPLASLSPLQSMITHQGQGQGLDKTVAGTSYTYMYQNWQQTSLFTFLRKSRKALVVTSRLLTLFPWMPWCKPSIKLHYVNSWSVSNIYLMSYVCVCNFFEKRVVFDKVAAATCSLIKVSFSLWDQYSIYLSILKSCSWFVQRSSIV